MKKVKTILTGILIVLASVFITACSCSEEADITHIYAQEMTLECLNDANNPRQEGSTLTIDANVGDTFQIRYNLSPEDITDTQVIWEISDKYYIEPVPDNIYSYTKSVSEEVSFRVKNYSTTDATKNRIIIKFRAIKGAQSVYYEENVLVNVYPAAGSKPTLSAPIGLKYDGTTGEISWQKVTSVELKGVVDTNYVENGLAKGLTGYTLKITDYDATDANNRTRDVVIGDRTQLKYPGANDPKDIFVKGHTYGFQVIANADNRNSLTSELSAEYRFHQLPYPEIVDEGNVYTKSGVIPVRTPQYSNTTVITYGILEQTQVQKSTFDTTPGVTNVNVRDFSSFSNMDNFNISMVTYPNNFFGHSDPNGRRYEDLGYTIGETSGVSNVRIYPSVECKMLYNTNTNKLETGLVATDQLLALTIEKFAAPNISMINTTGYCTISWNSGDSSNGEKQTTFEGSSLASVLKFTNNGRSITYQQYQTKYKVEIINSNNNQLAVEPIYISCVSDSSSPSSEQLNKELSLSSIPGLLGNTHYKLRVSKIGNERLVINSDAKEFEFYYLGNIGDGDRWYIDKGNVFTLRGEGPAISGLELYVVDQAQFANETTVNAGYTGNSKKIYCEASSAYIADADLSQIGLKPGTYQLYGRYIGVIDEGKAVCTATGNVSSLLLTFTVTAPIEHTQIKSDGKITWTPVDGVDFYDIYLGYTGSVVGLASQITQLGVIRVEKPTTEDDRYIHAKVSSDTQYYVTIDELVDFIVNRPNTLLGSAIDLSDTWIGQPAIMMLNQGSTFSYRIVAKGDKDSTPWRVDSIVTGPVIFGMIEPTGNKSIYNATFAREDNVTINDPLDPDAYVLHIELPSEEGKKYDNKQGLMFGVLIEDKNGIIDPITYWSGVITKNQYASGGANSDTVLNVPLYGDSGVKVNTGSGFVTIASLIKSENLLRDYNIAIIVRTIGSAGELGTKGLLNNESLTYFGAISTIPTDLEMTENGILTWNTPATQVTDMANTSIKYLVRFYPEDNDVTPDKWNEDILLRKVVSQNPIEYTYSLDVNDILVKGKRYVVKVQEIFNEGTFTNVESSGIIVMKLATPAVDRTATDKTFFWNNIDGANKYAYTIKNGQGNLIDSGIIDEDTLHDTTSYTIDAVLTEGEYTFRVVAQYVPADPENVTEYTIYSQASSIISGTFTVYPSVVSCVIDDTKLTWNTLDDNMSFTVKYWEADDPNSIQTIGLDANVTEWSVDNVFENGKTYQVQIMTSAYWLDGGYTIETNASEVAQSITRAYGVVSIDTTDGVLVITTYDTQDYVLQIFEYDAIGPTYTPIIVDEADITHTSDTDTYEVRLRNITPGTHNIVVRLAQYNDEDPTIFERVTSTAFGTATITKIGQVVVTGEDDEKLIKSGNYLYWTPVQYANWYTIKATTSTEDVLGTQELLVGYDGTNLNYIPYDYCDRENDLYIAITSTVIAVINGNEATTYSSETYVESGITIYDTAKDTDPFRKPVFTSGGLETPLSDTEIIILNVVDYINGRIKFPFDETMLIGEYTGVFYITITATTLDELQSVTNLGLNLINGETAIMGNTITKLNSNLRAGVENGQVVFYTLGTDENDDDIKVYNYLPDEDAETPIAIYVKIARYDVEEIGDPPKPHREYHETIEVVYSDSAIWTGKAANYYYTIEGNLPAISMAGQPIGTYEVRWAICGDGNYILSATGDDSELLVAPLAFNNVSHPYCILETIEKLDPVTVGSYLGELCWASPNELSNDYIYEVSITDESDTYILYVPASDLDSSEISGDPNLAYKFVLSEDKLLMGEGDNQELFILEPSKLYNFSVRVTAPGKLNSEWSEVFSARKLQAPSDVTVTMMQWSNNDKDSVNAIPVLLYTNNNSVNTTIKSQYKYDDGSIITSDTGIEPNATYKMMLPTNRALGNTTLRMRFRGTTTISGENSIGWLNSSFTEGEELTYIGDVSSVVVNNGVISWGEVDGAYSYKVTVYPKNQYNAYITYYFGGGIFAPTVKLVKYTTRNSYDLSATGIAESLTETGGYFVVINAITNPRVAIVSQNIDVALNYTNTANFYKPVAVDNYKVLDGMLSWTIAKSEITNFVNTVDAGGEDSIFEFPEEIEGSTTEQKIISYIYNRNILDISDAKLDSQLSHLIKFRMIVNSQKIADCEPTRVELIDNNGLSVMPSSNNIVAIRYYFNVGVDPETEITGNEIGASAGYYTIQVGAQGNSDTTAPVINSTYSTAIEAYKPIVPQTWLSNKADIRNGRVQWGLVPTYDPVSESWFNYQDYKVMALAKESDDRAEKIVHVSDTANPSAPSGNNNLTGEDDYIYYRDILGDLFRMSGSAQDKDILRYNTLYTILISTMGTEDSVLLRQQNPNATIYLNSNYCTYQEEVDVLAVTQSVQVKNSVLSWETSYGSTATRVFIYGPFDYLVNQNPATDYYEDENHNVIFKDGLETESGVDALYNLKEIYDLYQDYNNGVNGLTVNQINLANKLHIIDFATDELGERATEYTISDLVDNEIHLYGAGGYVIRLQEIGNGKGIIDSEISENYIANKLDMIEKANTTWLNANGQFEWNAVPYANRYRVIFIAVSEDGSTENKTEETVTSTYYEPQSGVDLNQEDKKYYIAVYAYRYDTVNGTEGPADWYFFGDRLDTKSYPRVFIPYDLTISNNGRIRWNGESSWEHIRGYKIQFNWIVEDELIPSDGREYFTIENESNIAVYDATHIEQTGSIRIRVKAIPNIIGNDEHDQIVSSYTTAIDVTRLSDPYARLVNGVFHWGLIDSSGADVDPITDTILTINGNEQIINHYIAEISEETGEETGETIFIPTNYPLFTDTDDLDNDYQYNVDVSSSKYPANAEYVFRVQSKGSGDPVTALDDTHSFYIASKEKRLVATKLPAPTLNVESISMAAHDNNAVYWLPVENAGGYRVYIVSIDVNGDRTTTIESISGETLVDMYQNNTVPENCSFMWKNILDASDNTMKDYIYFKLNDSISDTVKANGGEVRVYVQALGSGTEENPALYDGVETLYLSSSFTSAEIFQTPPIVKAIKLNETNGVFSWSWYENATDSQIASNSYDIRIEMTYYVSNVPENYMSYWIDSADTYEGQTTFGGTTYTANGNHPYGTISMRHVEATNLGGGLYNLRVVDVVTLSHNDLGSTYYRLDGDDPRTSGVIETTTVWYNYVLTTIGSNYSFEISAFNNGYSSDVFTNGISYSFVPFTSGDGSENYPYHVDTYKQLDNIRLFTNRDYLITSDIDFASGDIQRKYVPIENFTGKIAGGVINEQGNNRPVKLINVAYEIAGFTEGYNQTEHPISAFIYKNEGTITGIDFEMNHVIGSSENSYAGYDIFVATIAGRNYGEISNINITGVTSNAGIIVTPGACHQLLLGGVATYNAGVISNVTIRDITLSAMDNASSAAYAGGIVAIMEGGTITNSTIGGTALGSITTIKSNFVGGIVTELRNGTISRVVVTNKASLVITDRTTNESDTTRPFFKTSVKPQVGGIAAIIYVNSVGNNSVVLKNSYSQASIVVDIYKKDTVMGTTFTVGGVAGYVNAIGPTEIKNIYVVLNVTVNNIDSSNPNLNSGIQKDTVEVYNIYSVGNYNSPDMDYVYYYHGTLTNVDNSNIKTDPIATHSGLITNAAPDLSTSSDFAIAWNNKVLSISDGSAVFSWEIDSQTGNYSTAYPELNNN